MKNIMKKKIVALGLEPKSGNYGCVALAYSFFGILSNLSESLNLQLSVIAVCTNYFDKLSIPGLGIEGRRISFKKPRFVIEFIGLCKNADLIIDFSEGDSFTDIYGKHRFYTRSLLKEIAIASRKPFSLGPQTVGPFNQKDTAWLASKILKKAYKVFIRDEISKNVVKKYGVSTVLVTDIAFVLPYDREILIKSKDGRELGINVSGLLYNGGYKKNNDYNLKIDYSKFVAAIITRLQRNYTIHLIAHVFSNCLVEDDFAVCEKLHNKFPDTILAPRFESPMQAKSYMSKLDCLIGSRMHATIGAFSMGVPIIAVSYSRKFQGLYSSLGYPYVIDAKKVNEEEGLMQIEQWLENYDQMKIDVERGLKLVDRRTGKFVEEIKQILLK